MKKLFYLHFHPLHFDAPGNCGLVQNNLITIYCLENYICWLLNVILVRIYIKILKLELTKY